MKISREPGDWPELKLNFQNHGIIQAKLSFISSSGGKGVVPLFTACAAMPRLSEFMPKDPAWHATSCVSVPFFSDEEVNQLITFITMGSVSCSGIEESCQMKKLKVYKPFLLKIPA